MKTNHYGRLIDSETPITGVFNNNNLEFIWEEVDSLTSIDPDWYELTRSESFDPDYDYTDEYEQGEALIGFIETSDKSIAWYWFDNIGRGFAIDPDAEYSAIVNIASNTTQVVHSRWFIRSALSSPCYPGQADADAEGAYLAYSLPPDVIGDNDHELRRRVFQPE